MTLSTMNQSMTRTLVRKDVHMNRVFIIGSTLAGLVAVLLSSTSMIGFTIGGVMFITNIVAVGIFVGMYGVVQEREKRTHIFVFSLPVSARDYYVAKLLSSLISFATPWAISGAAAIISILALDELPDGLIPFLVLLLGFFLHNFSIFLCVSLVTQKELWVVATIVLTNMSISIFMPLVRRFPSIGDNVDGSVAVWSPAVFTILAVELAVIVAVLTIALTFLSRKKDFL